MGRTKYALASAAIIVLTIVAVPYFQAYYSSSLNSGKKQPLPSPSFGPQPPEINPAGETVSVIGFLRTSNVSPACSLSNPPCAVVNTPIYYIVISGRDYRLIFPNSIQPPEVFGHRVLVVGLYVTPSTFDTTQWTPSIYFNGDIYVQTLTYLRNFP